MPAPQIAILTIASGATASNAVSRVTMDGMESLGIYAPTTLLESVKVQVAPTESPVAGDWKALKSGGADVTLPADSCTVLSERPFGALRLLAAAAVAADRVFQVSGETRG